MGLEQRPVTVRCEGRFALCASKGTWPATQAPEAEAGTTARLRFRTKHRLSDSERNTAPHTGSTLSTPMQAEERCTSAHSE